jgi:hypothetical protein
MARRSLKRRIKKALALAAKNGSTNVEHCCDTCYKAFLVGGQKLKYKPK